MQVSEVMTHQVVTVEPGTTVRSAAEVMAERGFAALPVVDGGRLVGIVAEADLLRDRLSDDPRLHLRRDRDPGAGLPPTLVGDVMTREVRAVDVTGDTADVARVLVGSRLRSLPVTDGGRLVGIVSRRDLLRLLTRPDEDLRLELLHLVEEYTGESGSWDVTVQDGAATVRRLRGEPEVSAATEEGALSALARTVAGIVGVRVLPAAGPGDPV